MSRLVRRVTRLVTALNVWVYRRTNGRVGGRGLGRLPLLLLTVRGRNTGVTRTVPIAYFEHDTDYLVAATGMGGSARTPQWLLNLTAAGSGRVRIGDCQHDVAARPVTNAERAVL